MSLAHPHYSDGSPILLGDRVVANEGSEFYEDHGIVASIRWVRHKDEVWVHLHEPGSEMSSGNRIFHEDDLRKKSADEA